MSEPSDECSPLMIMIEARHFAKWIRELRDIYIKEPQASVFLDRTEAMRQAVRDMQDECRNVAYTICSAVAKKDTWSMEELLKDLDSDGLS